MRSVQKIHRMLFAACLSALWLGSIGFGSGTGQAAGAPLWPIVQTRQNTTANCTVPGALEGVDVSLYDGTIDWAQVAQTKAFAYARVSDGSTFTDTEFLTYYAGIRQAGMKVGAYLFFRPAQDPTQQANLLVSQLLRAGFAAGDLVPMIVLEVTDGKSSPQIAASLQTTVDVVKASLLVTPGIASGSTFLAWQTGSTAFANNPLWIELFSSNCPTPPLPWNNWAIWQYSDLGTVPGINMSVDLDRTNGASPPVYAGVLRTFLPLIIR
jgi:lysozyme